MHVVNRADSSPGPLTLSLGSFYRVLGASLSHVICHLTAKGGSLQGPSQSHLSKVGFIGCPKLKPLVLESLV